jgi:hypothetical protein
VVVSWRLRRSLYWIEVVWADICHTPIGGKKPRQTLDFSVFSSYILRQNFCLTFNVLERQNGIVFFVQINGEKELHWPCSLPYPNPKYFLFHPSHQIFRRMHGALNVGKKDN